MEIVTALYLIPVGISDTPLSDTLPAATVGIVRNIRHYIVENVRTARRFLKKCDRDIDIDTLTFCELNRHTELREVSGYLEPLRCGEPIGLMSEAGCPAIADPGAIVVGLAQREGLKVVPLVGPSSILMSLMASGFNGQGFAFHGYLPIEAAARIKTIRELEAESARKNMTQIFIEAPYRNNKMLAALVATLRSDTMLCVACDITDPEHECIISRPVSHWRGLQFNYDKRPAIFLIYSGSTITL